MGAAGTSPPSQRNTRTRPTPGPRLGGLDSGFFLLQVAQPRLDCAFCWWLFSALHSACFAVFGAWARWNRYPMPFRSSKPFSTASSSSSSSLAQAGLLRGRRVACPVRASFGKRVFVSLSNGNSGSLTARSAGQLCDVGIFRLLLASSSKNGRKCFVAPISLTV